MANVSSDASAKRRGWKSCVADLVSLCLEPLEDLFEAVQTGLAHSVQGIRPLGLPEVGRSAAAGGVEHVCFAVHILDHEVLTLELQRLKRRLH